ncbi:MAG: DUF4157 domain-containing protein [Gloeobacteraceae cyanobacterium ES-bin-316]|nr:DUF4157 domain-containing protein [Ferruginibacter sp.]
MQKAKYDLKENSWIARIAAWKLSASSVAIVIGHRIHLYNTTKEEFLKNTSWVKHELCHVRQFEQHGFFNFILKYIRESIRHGYYNNAFEIEARAAEHE